MPYLSVCAADCTLKRGRPRSGSERGSLRRLYAFLRGRVSLPRYSPPVRPGAAPPCTVAYRRRSGRERWIRGRCSVQAAPESPGPGA